MKFDLNTLFDLSLKLYDVGLTVKGMIAHWHYRKVWGVLKNNIELQNLKQSDVCYICGNGPSFKKVDVDELEGDMIVMNDYWRISSQFRKTPILYMIADDAYKQPSLRERFEGVMNCHPAIPHLFTIKMYEHVEKEKTNQKVYYFSPLTRTFNHNLEADFTKQFPNAWNVVSWSILLAVYMGYKEVRLLGCDYSLFASRFIEHMYDKDGVRVPCPYSLKDMLYKYSFATHIHYEIQKYALEHGVHIVNMTKATVLDAYEVDENSPY